MRLREENARILAFSFSFRILWLGMALVFCVKK